MELRVQVMLDYDEDGSVDYQELVRAIQDCWSQASALSECALCSRHGCDFAHSTTQPDPLPMRPAPLTTA